MQSDQELNTQKQQSHQQALQRPQPEQSASSRTNPAGSTLEEIQPVPCSTNSSKHVLSIAEPAPIQEHNNTDMGRSNKDQSTGDIKAMQREQREINAAAARRSRYKKREMQERMEKSYADNEKRIADLERKVDKLSSELRGTPFEEGSASNRSSAPRQGNQKSTRPEWFGEPF